MRDPGRVTFVGYVALALVFSLVLGSCGDSGGGSAEEARRAAELWDPQTGDLIAKPVKQESLEAAAFASFVEAGPARAAHVQMAAEMGYTTVLAAGRVTYDDGSVLTTAALSGPGPEDLAMLVVGALPGNETIPDASEVVLIAVPVFEQGNLVRVDFSGEKGAFSLDTTTGEVALADAEYGSCAPWNCLAGAIAFWWVDDSQAKDAYMGLMGEVCMDCLVLPLSQPVTCPACAVLLAAPLVASIALCTAWPCDLCVSDSCHFDEVRSRRCVTENGVSRVQASVTPWYCENPATQESQCVPGQAVVEVFEQCPWGCTPGAPTCQFPLQCLVGAPFACGGPPIGKYCSGGNVVGMYQKFACVSTDPNAGGVWGECVPLAGQYETQTTNCPYDCADGVCQLGPTCDPAVCERLQLPVGDPYCTVRPDDGRSVLVQEIIPHACRPVAPRVTPPSDWPPAQRCEPYPQTLMALEVCPGECNAAGTACAAEPTLILRPDGVNDWTFGEAAADVRAGFTALLGTPDETSEEGLGCLGDPADPSACEQTVRWQGFTAFFSLMGEGVFEGYTLDGRGSPGENPAATPEGIGIGSTVARLEAAYPQAAWREAFCGGIQGYVWPADFSGYRFTRSDAGLVDLIVAGFIPLFC